MSAARVEGEDDRGAAEPLRRLLAARARSLAAEALRTGGDVPAADVEALARLARLAEIARSAEPRPRPRRWPVVVLGAMSLLIVSILVFAPMPATTIELSTTVSGLGFELAEPQLLVDAVEVTALGASGLSRIDVPPSCLPPGRPVLPADTSRLRLSVESLARPGQVALGALTLPAGASVRVHQGDRPNAYRITLAGLAEPVPVSVHRRVSLVLAGQPEVVLDCVTPRAVTLVPASGDVDLDLELRQARPRATRLRVRQLALTRVETNPAVAGGARRVVSTVLGGGIYFEFNGEERRLRAGEDIRFAGSEGEIRSLRWTDEHLVLEFRGRVRDMRTGGEDHRRSLMPSPLERLRASQGDLAVIWGGTLYVMGLVLAVLRWWRNPT
jgi:hypothetical protein